MIATVMTLLAAGARAICSELVLRYGSERFSVQALSAALVLRDVDELPGGFESPVIALQLAHSVDEAAPVIEGCDLPLVGAVVTQFAVTVLRLRR
jgi:hypothetical protein